MARTVASIVGFVCIGVMTGCNSETSAKNGTFLDRGKEYAEKKDYARAVLQFRNESKLLPKSPEPYYQIGLAYLGMRDGRAAVAHFKKAVELDPNHIGAQIKLAELTAMNQNKDVRKEAEERAKGVLKQSPGNADALSVIALTEIASGNEQAGEKQLLDALQTAPQHLKSAVILAGLKMRNKDSKGAETVLRSVAERDPQSVEAALALGRFYGMLQRREDAARELERAVKLQPTNGAALLSLAQLQIALGKPADAEQNLRRLSALPDKQYRTAHAMFLYQTNQRDAIAELEQICGKDPTDRSARALLVHGYLAANRHEDVEKLLASALKENPKDIDALLQRSDILLKAGKYAEAQNDLTQVLGFTPDSAQAHRLMARIHQARGSNLQGRQELAEALRLNPNLLEARLELAEDHLQGGSRATALEVLDKAPQTQRQSLPLLTKRNKVLLAMRKFAEARTGINQGLKVARTRELLLLDSQLRLAQKDYSGARTAAEEVLKSFPEDVEALEYAAFSIFRENRPDASLQRIRDQVALRPGSARLQYFLGLQLIAKQRREEARSALGAAVQADKSFFPAVLELARMDINDGRTAEAREMLTQLLSSKISELPARMFLAQMDVNASNYAGAIEHYRRALDTSPKHPVAMNNLASILADQENGVDEALKYAQQTKEMVPNDPTVDDTLGWAFYRKGIYKTAVQHLRVASAKNPDAGVKYHLAMAYFKAGDIDNAQKTLEVALKQSPNAREAAAARQLIAQR